MPRLFTLKDANNNVLGAARSISICDAGEGEVLVALVDDAGGGSNVNLSDVATVVLPSA